MISIYFGDIITESLKKFTAHRLSSLRLDYSNAFWPHQEEELAERILSRGVFGFVLLTFAGNPREQRLLDEWRSRVMGWNLERES